MMRITTCARAAVATLAMAGAGIISAAADPVAAAEAAPQPANREITVLHGDVCGPGWASFVPDSGPVFDFHDACHGHDDCYGAAPYGRNELGRLRCDQEFRADMIRSCNNRYPHWWQGLPLRSCVAVALTYYSAVRAGGSVSFY